MSKELRIGMLVKDGVVGGNDYYITTASRNFIGEVVGFHENCGISGDMSVRVLHSDGFEHEVGEVFRVDKSDFIPLSTEEIIEYKEKKTAEVEEEKEMEKLKLGDIIKDRMKGGSRAPYALTTATRNFVGKVMEVSETGYIQVKCIELDTPTCIGKIYGVDGEYFKKLTEKELAEFLCKKAKEDLENLREKHKEAQENLNILLEESEKAEKALTQAMEQVKEAHTEPAPAVPLKEMFKELTVGDKLILANGETVEVVHNDDEGYLNGYNHDRKKITDYCHEDYKESLVANIEEEFRSKVVQMIKFSEGGK